MKELTRDELLTIMPIGKSRIDKFLNELNTAMAEFEISESYERMAAFLAQIAHESGELLYVREIASGEAYEGRKDLGNTIPGDGVRFKGRGLIQITGRSNYGECSKALYGISQILLDNPELLEHPKDATRSAAWFWKSRGLNEIMDKDTEENFKLITRKINGGLTHYDKRKEYWIRAQEALGA